MCVLFCAVFPCACLLDFEAVHLNEVINDGGWGGAVVGGSKLSHLLSFSAEFLKEPFISEP